MARRISRSAAVALAVGLASGGASGCAAAIGTGVGVGGLVAYYKLTGGGAMSEKNLKRETGRIINVDPDMISVYDIDRGALNVSWMASTPDGIYKCSADDMVRRPACFKQGGGGAF